MKRTRKLLVFLCMFVILLCPLSVFAEDTVDVPTEETTTMPEEVTPDVVPEDTTPEATPPATNEGSSEFDWGEVKDTISGYIVNWVQPHIEEISVVVAIIGFIIDNRREKKYNRKNMSVMNNNAITMAQDNAVFMGEALTSVRLAAEAVTNYDDQIVKLLESFKNNAEDRKKLETQIIELKEYLAVATKANTEFANELAELLALANIPNYKKEEIGARHLKHVTAILEAEAHAEKVAEGLMVVEEVKENVGKET